MSIVVDLEIKSQIEFTLKLAITINIYIIEFSLQYKFNNYNNCKYNNLGKLKKVLKEMSL